MTPNDLSLLSNTTPRPRLVLYLADGSEYDVGPDDDAYVALTTLCAGHDPDVGGIPQQTDYIDIRLVVRVRAIRAREFKI